MFEPLPLDILQLPINTFILLPISTIVALISTRLLLLLLRSRRGTLTRYAGISGLSLALLSLGFGILTARAYDSPFWPTLFGAAVILSLPHLACFALDVARWKRRQG